MYCMLYKMYVSELASRPVSVELAGKSLLQVSNFVDTQHKVGGLNRGLGFVPSRPGEASKGDTQ